MNGWCMICHVPEIDVHHLPLYVIGSEGLWLCHGCEMKLVKLVQDLMQTKAEERKAAVLAERTVAAGTVVPAATRQVRYLARQGSAEPEEFTLTIPRKDTFWADIDAAMDGLVEHYGAEAVQSEQVTLLNFWEEEEGTDG